MLFLRMAGETETYLCTAECECKANRLVPRCGTKAKARRQAVLTRFRLVTFRAAPPPLLNEETSDNVLNARANDRLMARD